MCDTQIENHEPFRFKHYRNAPTAAPPSRLAALAKNQLQILGKKLNHNKRFLKKFTATASAG
jgi:hypothetical protein